MQLSLELVVGWLGELLGWASIIGGMVLAAHTLGLRVPVATTSIVNLGQLRSLAGMIVSHCIVPPRVADAVEPSLWPIDHAPVDVDIDPQRLAVAAYFHARAMEELEAADDALTSLLADIAPFMTLTSVSHTAHATAAPLDEPMAA
jgi:hypothetical protein